MDPGRTLSKRYVLERELGRGRMGVVFAGRDHLLEREVAIKLIQPSQTETPRVKPSQTEAPLIAQTARRFEQDLLRETKMVAGLSHPGIVPVYDFGRDGDLLFLVMPLLHGRTLRRLLDAGPLPVPLVAELGRQVATALAHSHAHGVVHGDLEPENLMLSSDASGLQVRVMDFGLAALAHEERSQARPSGALSYMAPEQTEGHGVDGRADLYSLGAILYEAVAGRPPFTGNREALLDAIKNATAVRPGLLRNELPREIEVLIVSLLAKDPARRPGSARDVAEQLEPYANGSSAATLLGYAGLGAGHSAEPDTHAPLLYGAVGRDTILRAIDTRLTAARAGELQMVLLAGEAGMGKTTVLDELALACQAREVELLRTSATVGGWLGAFGEMLTAGLAQRPEAAELLARDAAKLVEIFPTLDRSRLANLARKPVREPSWAGLEQVDKELRRKFGTHEAKTLAELIESESQAGERPKPATEIQRLLVRAFEALVANGRALALAIDDAHLSEETVEFLAVLFRRLPRAPILIVLTYERSALRPTHALVRVHTRLATHPRALDIELEPIAPEFFDALISQLLGGGEPSLELPDWLYLASGGRPHYARELVRAGVETGALVQREGVWHLDANEWPIPASLRNSMTARLRRLPLPLRSALRIASVLALGDGSFDLDELAELHGRPRGELEMLLGRALDRQLLSERRYQGRVTLRFTSDVARRIVHDELEPGARRKLHLHRAAHLSRLPYSETTIELNELLSLAHLVEAGAADAARPLVVALAQRALEQNRPERALPHLLSLLDVADELPPTDRAELHLLAAELEHMRGEARAAVSALQRLAATLDESDDPRLDRLGERGAIFATKLGHRNLADRLLGLRPRDRRAAERQRRARAEVAALRPATSSRSMNVGDLYLMHGEYTRAREVYERARRRASADSDLQEEARQLQNLTRVASKLGHYDSAIGYCREGLRLLERRRSLERVGLWAMAAFAHNAAGYYDHAEAELAAGEAELATFTEPSAARDRVAALLERARGDWLMAEGRAQDAIGAYERCLSLHAESDSWIRSVARLHLGEACALAGDATRALREYERAVADKRAIGDRSGLAYTHIARVRVLDDLGRISDAGEVLVDARGITDEIEDPRLFALVHVQLARNAMLSGQLELAVQEARRARDMARTNAAHAEYGGADELLATIDLVRGDRAEARRHAEQALETARRHNLEPVEIGALLILAEASPADERPELLDLARAAGEAHGSPFRDLDISLTGLRLGLGDPHHAGDDYVALEQLSDRASSLSAMRHVGLCLIAQAEVLAPHDLRGALAHARLGEGRLRSLGAHLEADRAGELIARLTLR